MPRPSYERIIKQRDAFSEEIVERKKEINNLAKEIIELKNDLAKDTSQPSSNESLIFSVNESIRAGRDVIDKCCRHKAGRRICESFGCWHLLQIIKPLEDFLSSQEIPASTSLQLEAVNSVSSDNVP